MMTFSLPQILYGGQLLLCMWGAMGMQHYRHQRGPGVLYAAYTGLIFFLGWELLDCVAYGAPGFPSQRWFLYGALALIFCIGTVREARARRMLRARV